MPVNGLGGEVKTVNDMMRMGWSLAIALATFCPLAVAGSESLEGADVRSATASNGAVIVMPDLAGLGCDAMDHVLRRIDLSNYRGPDAVPEGHPDWPIFEYEDLLTRQYYYDCTLGLHQLEDPGTAFSFGFESQ